MSSMMCKSGSSSRSKSGVLLTNAEHMLVKNGACWTKCGCRSVLYIQKCFVFNLRRFNLLDSNENLNIKHICLGFFRFVLYRVLLLSPVCVLTVELSNTE